MALQMTMVNGIPSAAYGILQQNHVESVIDEVVEQVRALGYAILDSGYKADNFLAIAEEFDRTREHYLQTYGEEKLRSINEFHNIRSPLTHGGEVFLRLALNENLLAVVTKLISILSLSHLVNPVQ